jgi:replicative DNA helicase
MSRKLSNIDSYNAVAERTVIGSLLQYGSELFYDIDTILNESDFYLPENKIIFSVIKKLVVEDKIEKPDSVSILAFIKSTNEQSIKDLDLVDYLGALGQQNIPINNISPFCKRVKILSLVRHLKSKLDVAKDQLSNLHGKESILDIISIAESPITQFTNEIIHNDSTSKISKEIDKLLEDLSVSKPGYRGIPSGFAIYDRAIGGGFIKPGVHVIGARAKVGKTRLAIDISEYVTGQDIPVLYLDTEMTKESTFTNLLSNISDIPYDDINTGLKTINNCKQVKDSLENIRNRKFYYHNISGQTHQVWISVIRRWLLKEVGFNTDGTCKNCLIVLDYLKTMNTKDFGDLQEYQYLGQVITDLHNLCIQYHIPILSFVQLNREGISSSGQGVIAGSDRIIALCSSFSILRKKEQQDYAQCPPSTGDRKIEIIAARYGPGLDDTQYINLKTDLSKCRFEETVLNTDFKPNVEQNHNLIVKDGSK